MNPYAAPQTVSTNDPPKAWPIYAWFYFTLAATLAIWWPVLFIETDMTMRTAILSVAGFFVLVAGSWMCAIFNEAYDAALKAWRERNPERPIE